MIKSASLPEVFSYFPPKDRIMGILSIPHSGETLPEEFRSYLVEDDWSLMQDVDYRVHQLVDIPKLQASGVAVIYSQIIRTAVDLNRAKKAAVLNWKENSKGVKIIRKMPSAEIIERLQEKYHTPYYEMLKTMILELQASSDGVPPLIDLHSMPSQAEDYHMRQNPGQEKIRPDFCLSDNHGVTCEKSVIANVGDQLQSYGYKVLYNNPYIGGNITKFLHENYVPLNNFQIEISRALYMNEQTKELKKDFINTFKIHLTETLIKALGQA